MLLTTIKCSNCGAYHDATLEECPECHKNNELRTLKEFPKRVFFLHPLAQLALFIIGFAYLGKFVGELFLSAAISSVLWIEIIVYLLIIAGALVIIFLTRRKMFIEHMKRYEFYIMGIVFGVIAVGIGILVLQLVSIWYKGDPNGNQYDAESLLLSYPIPAFFLFAFLGPISEELTYRVGLYSLLRRYNKYLALILTTIVFALIHFRFNSENIVGELWSLPSYLIAGFILTFAYEKGGLSSSLTAHVIYNIVSFVMTLVQYGQQA